MTERDSVIKVINAFDDNIQTVLDGIQKEVYNNNFFLFVGLTTLETIIEFL